MLTGLLHTCYEDEKWLRTGMLLKPATIFVVQLTGIGRYIWMEQANSYSLLPPTIVTNWVLSHTYVNLQSLGGYIIVIALYLVPQGLCLQADSLTYVPQGHCIWQNNIDYDSEKDHHMVWDRQLGSDSAILGLGGS